jgi:hypothetical protein
VNGVVAPAFAAALVILIFGRIFVQRWLMREHSAGRMTGRKAGWIFGATIAAPSLLILIFIALRDLGSVWILALVFAAMAPVQIIPWVALFRYPDDSAKSKRFPPG